MTENLQTPDLANSPSAAEEQAVSAAEEQAVPNVETQAVPPAETQAVPTAEAQVSPVEELPAGDFITVKTTMSRWDFSKLRTYYMYRIHPGRIRNLSVAVVLAAALVAGGKIGWLPQALYMLGAASLVCLTGTLIWIDSRAKKLEKPGKSIGNRLQQIILGPTGFTVEWTNYSVPLSYTWEQVILAVESDQHFFLFVNKLAAIILPKRGMKPEKISRVHEFIEVHVAVERQDLSGAKL